MGLTRGRGREGEVVDVELVDAADEDVPAWFARTRTPDRRTTRRRGPSRRVWIAGIVVVVVIAAFATVRQATHDALVAGLGRGGVVLLPLGEALTESWRTEEDEITGDMGSLLLVRDANSTRALDARSGATQWQRELTPRGATEVCRPLSGFATRTYPSVGTQGPGTWQRRITDVVCLRTSPVGGLNGEAPGSDSPRSTTATVLAGSSGEPGRTLTVAGSVVASHVYDGDLVLVTAADDATLRLTRWDPTTGSVAWRREVPPAEAAGLRFAGWQREILTIAGRAGTIAYSLESGRELRVRRPLPPQVVAVELAVLPGDIEVIWGYYDDADAEAAFPGGAGVVVHPDDREVPLPGPPLRVGVDDGAQPSILLVATSPTSVGALDVADGAILWEVEHSAASQVAVRVDGAAVVVDGDLATAVDVRTGAVLWTARGLADQPGSLGLTDGEQVLLRHAQRNLAAHDLKTGAVTWTAPLPEGTEDVLALAAGRVVAVGPGWVAGLG